MDRWAPAPVAPSRPSRDGRSTRQRDAHQRPQDCQKGFVTKLYRHEVCGFISADDGGAEIRFEPSTVVGEKRYQDLQIGDYVEFAVSPETRGTKLPIAFYVCEIERNNYFPQTQLSRHPNSRRKKPSWR